MALNLTQLSSEIESALNAAYAETDDSKAAQTKLAKSIATAIDKYVRAGTVVGTCATPSGPGTVTGTVE
jgi:ElaB/YqjD/DUF883 family membrane-anchored ribosome-binding protein